MLDRETIYTLSIQYNIPHIIGMLDFTHYVDDGEGVAYTDGMYIYITPNFLKFDVEEQFFVLCHETLHILYDHINLKKLKEQGHLFFRKPELFNIAADTVINTKLFSLLGYVPDGAITFESLQKTFGHNLVKPKPFTTKNVYRKLDETIYGYSTGWADDQLKKLNDLKNTVNGTVMKSTHAMQQDIKHTELQAQKQKDILSKIKNEMKITDNALLLENPTMCTDAGKTTNKPTILDTSNITQTISTKEITKFIKNYVGKQIKIRGKKYTYTRPNRRLESTTHILRGSKPYHEIKHVSIFLDISSSMSEMFCESMYVTLRKEHLKIPFDFTLFTTSLYKIDFKKDKFMFGGGTSINKVLHEIETNTKIETNILITDCQDTFNLDRVNKPLLLFTDNQKIKTSNPFVTITYFK